MPGIGKLRNASSKMVAGRQKKATQEFDTISDGLKTIYKHKLKPMEVSYGYDQFYGPLLSENDLEAKPIVLLLGQYSTGKSTFVQYLLGGNYPGIHIGPEPTVT